MKKSLLAMTALAAMLFAGCTSSDELTTLESIKKADNVATPISFGTYMGKTGTRAGVTGNMTTATMASSGFGVFAYYTEDDTYGSFRKSTYTGESAAGYAGTKQINFMYNQQVTSVDPYTNWTYTPLKYWPNGNANADNASATGTPGGNVSFFAYAPYVATSAADGTGTGIIGMTANNIDSDPILTYKLDNTNGVDLLWGTLNTADVTVNGIAQVGVSYNNGAAANTYARSILPHETSPGSGSYDGYTLAADLTKQKTDGKISYLFKHSLAGLGGGSGVSNNIGFQAILDIDAITGGSREKFDVDNSGSDDDWRTIVTIKSIQITNDLNGDASIGVDEVGQASQGTFNLATGKWTATYDQVVSHSIGKGTGSYDAVLYNKIAEYYDNTSTTWLSHAGSTNNYFNKSYSDVNGGTHPGVTETAQNVYEESTQSPLLFIPGTTAPKFKITVDYIVRTYDVALAAGYSEVEQIVSKTITFPAPLELNKHYDLLMHLGLTSVKFTATVSDWAEATIGDSNVDGTPDNMIFLPINVQ